MQFKVDMRRLNQLERRENVTVPCSRSQVSIQVAEDDPPGDRPATARTVGGDTRPAKASLPTTFE